MNLRLGDKMQFDMNGYARYEIGDYALIVDGSKSERRKYWFKNLNDYIGAIVKIKEEGNDDEGYYYRTGKIDCSIDISFLRPAPKFELSLEEDDELDSPRFPEFLSMFKVVC